MNISITQLHGQLAAGASALAEDKFRALEKLMGDSAGAARLDCEVEESIAAVRAGARFKATGNLDINGERYHAEAMNDTLEGAIDQMRDELARELHKASGKERGLLRRGGRAVKGWLRF